MSDKNPFRLDPYLRVTFTESSLQFTRQFITFLISQENLLKTPLMSWEYNSPKMRDRPNTTSYKTTGQSLRYFFSFHPSRGTLVVLSPSPRSSQTTSGRTLPPKSYRDLSNHGLWMKFQKKRPHINGVLESLWTINVSKQSWNEHLSFLSGSRTKPFSVPPHSPSPLYINLSPRNHPFGSRRQTSPVTVVDPCERLVNLREVPTSL